MVMDERFLHLEAEIQHTWMVCAEGLTAFEYWCSQIHCVQLYVGHYYGLDSCRGEKERKRLTCNTFQEGRFFCNSQVSQVAQTAKQVASEFSETVVRQVSTESAKVKISDKYDDNSLS